MIKQMQPLLLAAVLSGSVFFMSASLPTNEAPSNMGKATTVSTVTVAGDSDNAQAAAWVRAAVWLTKEAIKAAGRGAQLLSITYLCADGVHSDVIDVPADVKFRELDK